jgi:allantoicase|tara:strand:- start:8882 stop:10015 length:1134 start_codon:yes stop_codon:yes gene_type:complete
MSLVAKGNRLSARYTDLAARRLGGQALSCSNDFFAEMENLLKAEAPIFQPGVFTERGQLMDGWESRRRRFLPDGSSDDGLQFDWCIIKLGSQGIIRGINANTAHFLGNAPQQVSLEVCNIQGEPTDTTEWIQLIDITDVNPGSDNLIDVSVIEKDGQILSEQVWTHVRFNMFPDGGVARLNIYGEIVADQNWFLKGEPLDLAYIKNGARPVACSDMFFSAPENVLMPERGANMGDGWETKRRRSIGDVEVDRGNDWLILQLATRGNIEKILIDTCHFKGNYPNAFALEGAVLTAEQAANKEALSADSHLEARFDKTGGQDQLAIEWTSIIERTALYADREHTFKDEVTAKAQSFTHVRLKMFPDGGISRIRLWGFPA